MPNITISISDALLAEIVTEANKDSLTPQVWARRTLRQLIADLRISTYQQTREVSKQQAIQAYSKQQEETAAQDVTDYTNQLENTL